MAGQNKNNNQEVDTKQLLKVRREKLADLQERGKDPFQITKYDVTPWKLKNILTNQNVDMMKKAS